MAPAPHVADAFKIEAYLMTAAGFLHAQLVALGVAPDVAARISESWRVGTARELEQLIGMASICVAPTPVVARRALGTPGSE